MNNVIQQGAVESFAWHGMDQPRYLPTIFSGDMGAVEAPIIERLYKDFVTRKKREPQKKEIFMDFLLLSPSRTLNCFTEHVDKMKASWHDDLAQLAAAAAAGAGGGGGGGGGASSSKKARKG